MTTLVDTATAAVAVGVRPATIRQWVHRGRLTIANRDGDRNLYRLDDLLDLVDTTSSPVTP